MNPLKKLQDCGQSIWLDYIKRSFITGGDLQRLIDIFIKPFDSLLTTLGKACAKTRQKKAA